MLKTFVDEIVANGVISPPDCEALPAPAARIVRAQWQEWVEGATRDAVERVVEPAEALAREAVPGEGPDATSSVVRRLRQASPYDYFPEIVEQYAGRKGISEMTSESLASLLRRIDQRMTADFTADEWISLAESLFELGRVHPTGAVPAELVRRFLKARGAGSLVAHIPNTRSLTADDFRKALMAVFPAVESPGSPSETSFSSQSAGDGVFGSPPDLSKSTEPTVAEALGGTETGIRTQQASTSRDSDEAAPLWKRFLGNGGSEVTEDNEKETEHVPLWRRFFQPADLETEAASHPEGKNGSSSGSSWSREPETQPTQTATESLSLESLEKSVLGEGTGEWRSLYVDSLFNGKKEEYERVLSMLLLAGDWAEASEIIKKEVFKKHKVDIYAVPAVAFTDAVEAQYAQ